MARRRTTILERPRRRLTQAELDAFLDKAADIAISIGVPGGIDVPAQDAHRIAFSMTSAIGTGSRSSSGPIILPGVTRTRRSPTRSSSMKHG
jgi:hypothetical protein